MPPKHVWDTQGNSTNNRALHEHGKGMLGSTQKAVQFTFGDLYSDEQSRLILVLQAKSAWSWAVVLVW